MLYALGTLPEGEVEEFEALARSNREVRALLHETQELTELDATEGPLAEAPFHVYSKLMERIDAETGVEPVAVRASKGKSVLVSFAGWGGWAAAACFAIALGFVASRSEGPAKESDIVLNNLRNPKLVAVQTPSAEVSMEDRLLELMGIAEAYWFAREGIPSGQLLEDEDTEVAQLTGGFTVIDRKYNIGFIAVENLPKESLGKSYHIWARTSKGARSIQQGVLPIGDESRGLFFLELSDLPEGVTPESLSFFVTEEESDNPEQPSQMVVLSDA